MTAVLRDLHDLRALVRGWKAAGQSVGVVPTMGALHQGHLSLVRAAQAGCERVIVTIFINPRQFNNPADLQKYPRTEEADKALLQSVGPDAIFAPQPDQVYPLGFASTVSVSGISAPMEGAHRPGHFDGVATVVAKLFGMTMAERAYFGHKDWQQLQVVQRMVADLNLPVEVIGCETLRESDGLAMSSRNARLSPKARLQAAALYRALTAAAEGIRIGTPVAAALKTAQRAVLAGGFDAVDYIDLRSARLLEPMPRLDRPARLLAAATIEDVRLIDNIAV